MWDQVTQIETCGTKGPSQNNKQHTWRVKNREGAQVHCFMKTKYILLFWQTQTLWVRPILMGLRVMITH